jgi:hypothetical protein
MPPRRPNYDRKLARPRAASAPTFAATDQVLTVLAARGLTD